MTADGFRRIALSFDDAVEKSHMRHPDFRVQGKIFATLGYPDEDWGMVKLTPEEQQNFVQAEPSVFVPVRGAWGKQGCTSVRLKGARPTALRRAMAVAWRTAVEKANAPKVNRRSAR
jgi:hypothetical protein